MALLIVVGWLALMIALISEFTYGTNVNLAQAANARDELRAHYMARSAVSLSRLLVKIQQRFVDPVMNQAQQMLTAAGGQGLGISLRVTDYAGPVMGFFGGGPMEIGMLGGFIGIDVGQVKGLGLKSGRFDAEITSEDWKIDLNCGSGLGNAAARDKQLTVYRLLMAMMWSQRYERLFSTPDAKGRTIDRDSMARALLDWADADDQMISPDGATAGSEDYQYDQRADPYRAHDNSYDTVDEIAQVRGARETFLEAFEPYLTVYASDPSQRCRVNLGAVKGECTPLLMGVLRAAAVSDFTKPPSDPGILDDKLLYPLASVLCERGGSGGFDSLDTLVQVLQNPQLSVAPDDPRYAMMQALRSFQLTKPELEKVAYVGSPRVYRLVATGESGKVRKKITVVLDTARTVDNPLTLNPASEKDSGVIQYWREE